MKYFQSWKPLLLTGSLDSQKADWVIIRRRKILKRPTTHLIALCFVPGNDLLFQSSTGKRHSLVRLKNMNILHHLYRKRDLAEHAVHQNKVAQNKSMEDYSKDGGPGGSELLCSFYHNSLRAQIKRKVDNFSISARIGFKSKTDTC